MAGNTNLRAANKAKKDEFYTQLVDIENELKHYKEHFKGKTVLCNCDDPRVSNFFHYFSYNFEKLGLKKLIATCYKSQNRDLFSKNDSEKAIWLEYNGDKNGNRVPDPEEIGINYLKGDGDFRSQECIELLKQSDIVVTNPPFSLFREYVAQLIEYEKKFLIIGNKNAITYKEIFRLIKDNKLWIGCTPMSQDLLFEWPQTMQQEALDKGKVGSKFRIVNGKMLGRSPSIWYTNLDHKKRHEELILYKSYTSEEYPTYENYHAINVDKTVDIPLDFDGDMGVPITFLDKYNPDQFDIIGLGIANLGIECGVQPYKPEHRKYRKEIQKRGVVDGDLYMMVDDVVTVPYARILIRRRQQIPQQISQQNPLRLAAEPETTFNTNK
ncbi:MAG: adenine-specific methyltransferase EcoRI family protein [Bacteroidales bacterium]|nr:adenine-specific methyltransferase EcoRI family protein [Bacteroidales bacterium]